jgi:hypothetical protein
MDFSAADFAQDAGFKLICPDSVGADRVFNISDPHPLASPARESNTDCPQYSTLCMYPYLVSVRASL